MAEPLKEMFNYSYYNELAHIFKQVYTNFNETEFIEQVMESIENRSLNERLRFTNVLLQRQLPTDFASTVVIFNAVITKTKVGYTNLIFPDYIAQFGGSHFEISMKALALYTQYGSSEFAIRTFLEKDFSATMQMMLQWAQDENLHVRRLASEGCRLRLPWAKIVPELSNNLDLIIAILEQLREDSSEYVRRSVANNLNDLSKSNPEMVVAFAQKWMNTSPITNSMLRHACRTLLKQGNSEILKLFELNAALFEISEFTIDNQQVAIGDYLEFEFKVHNNAELIANARLEFAIHYLRQNNTHNKKVFKITDRQVAAKTSVTIRKKQSFKIITTRKFYPGIQRISIIVNGQIKQTLEFTLLP
ncbi:MAG: DNA alkylation repair protein [Flavobacterium sp.]